MNITWKFLLQFYTSCLLLNFAATICDFVSIGCYLGVGRMAILLKEKWLIAS